MMEKTQAKPNNFTDLDHRLSQNLRLNAEARLWRKLAAFLAHSGDSWFWLAGLLVIWLATGQGWHHRAALMILGIVLLAAVVMLIKFIVRRQRPQGEWGAIYRSVDPHSFPSGHAARAALLAVMAWQLGPPWFAALLAIWAPLVSLARVAMGVHYLSDIVAGLAIGILMAWLMLLFQPFIAAFFPFLFYDWGILLRYWL